MVKLKLSSGSSSNDSSPMRSHHNIYITSHDFNLRKERKKHHQQIKVIKHDGYFFYDMPSCRV